MASALTNKRPKSSAGPTELKLRLHAPGMSALHRAGLGGLAATLRALERRHRNGRLPDHQLPGSPQEAGGYRWRIEPSQITFLWDEPAEAAEYLQRLFSFAFGLRDGLIDLPGTYRTDLSLAVRTELQQALVLTFLQHGKTRALAKQPVPIEIDPTGDGTANLRIQYRPCYHYRHQDEWKSLVDGKGCLVRKPISIEGPLAPGAAVRHNAFAGQTKLEEPPDRALPLIFALIGCLSLAINPVTGALLVPEVDDLQRFANDRPRMTPHTLAACRIGGAGDAALQTMLRLRARRLAGRHGFAGLHVNVLAPTAWASQQKTRTKALFVPTDNATEDGRLQRFDRVLRHLRPQVRSKAIPIKSGRKNVGTDTQWIWVDSIVRPLAADNLAAGRRWYRDFWRLMQDRQCRKTIEYERKELSNMLQPDISDFWENEAEKTVVKAVHEALSRRYGAIADQYKTNRTGRENKWENEYERWRLAFAGAKTADRFRNALCDLLSRAGPSGCLRDNWESLLPMINDRNWQLCRDLALLALPSYSGGKKDKSASAEPVKPEEPSAMEQTP